MSSKDGGDMHTYSVYRIDYLANKTERIGRLLERRREERKNNAGDMLRLAQNRYGYPVVDSHLFVIRERSPGIIL